MPAFKHPKINSADVPEAVKSAAGIKPRGEVILAGIIANQKAEEARLWASYCDLRDEIMAIHADCLANKARSPRMVFIFAATKCPWRSYRPPVYTWPARRIKWLKQAVEFAQYVVDNPGGKTAQDSRVKIIV
jgi:hypothetical protein